MVFVAPKRSAEQALVVVVSVWVLARRNKRRFRRIMAALQQHNCFRVRSAAPPVDRPRSFDAMLDDATAKVRYRFTVAELYVLAAKLKLPKDGIETKSGDRVNRVEALAMLCRRLSEPSKLLTVASEFGRSMAPYSRVVKTTAQLLVNQHRDLVYFNYYLVKLRIDDYAAAIHAKGSPLRTCWAFIDGTKQYVARPSARAEPASQYENLQRSLYNGHPRRHCFNWQSVQAPDGILVSLYGPLEGRRHDSTMFNLSGLIDKLEEDQSGISAGN